jgi:hypothetical protein
MFLFQLIVQVDMPDRGQAMKITVQTWKAWDSLMLGFASPS